AIVIVCGQRWMPTQGRDPSEPGRSDEGGGFMFRFVASGVVLLLAVTFVMSEEFTGIITKFEDGKDTFKKGGFGKKKDPDAEPEEKTLPTAANVKYMKAKFNLEDKKLEADGELEGGKDAFAKQVKDAAEKKGDKGKGKGKGFGFGGGVFAQIITEGEGD